MKITRNTIFARMQEIKSDLNEELRTAGMFDAADEIDATPMKLNDRLTTTAGRANIRLGFIEIATKVFADPDNFPNLSEVVRHEFAHILAHKFDNERGHGKAWRAWAESCGSSGARCHTMKVERRTVRRVTVIGECDRCGANTYANRGTLAALIIENKRSGSVTHRNCGGEFKYSDLC